MGTQPAAMTPPNKGACNERQKRRWHWGAVCATGPWCKDHGNLCPCVGKLALHPLHPVHPLHLLHPLHPLHLFTLIIFYILFTLFNSSSSSSSSPPSHYTITPFPHTTWKKRDSNERGGRVFGPIALTLTSLERTCCLVATAPGSSRNLPILCCGHARAPPLGFATSVLVFSC